MSLTPGGMVTKLCWGHNLNRALLYLCAKRHFATKQRWDGEADLLFGVCIMWPLLWIFLTEVINRAISFLQELVSFPVMIQSGSLNVNVDLASSSSPEEEPDLWNHRVSFECEAISPDHAGSNCHWRLSLSSFSFHLPPSPLVSHGPVANPRRYCRHIFIISERLRAHYALMSLWTVAPLIRRKMLLRTQWSVHITAPAAGGWADVILHL